MKYLMTLFVCLWTCISFAQHTHSPKCGMDHVHHLYEQDYPGFALELERYRQELPVRSKAAPRSGSVILRIPVVIHVIHGGTPEGIGANLSDSRLLTQIDALNEDYRRQNDDANQTPTAYSGIAADCEIEFCLAAVDPNGNPTNGITRHIFNSIPSISYMENQVKTATTWDPDRYLNIWTADLPDNTILGYSYLPTSNIVGSTRDGVVLTYTKFGVTSNSNRGRTTTHEVGHYLGLMHMWGSNDSDGNPIGCGSDDGVEDTPNSDGPYYQCPNFGPVSCGSTDMNMNYMDYVDDDCMNLFTLGQKTLMHNTLTGIRSSLLDNNLTLCNINLDCVNLDNSDIVMGFESNQSTDDWAIEDANGDGTSWNIRQDFTEDWGANNGSGLAVYFWNEDGINSADDYLFTPCFAIEQGHYYRLSFAYAAASDQNGVIYPERLEVGLSGNQNSSDFFSFNDWVLDPITNVYPNYNNESYTFIANEDGQLSIGFRAFSDSDQYALQLDDIRVVDLGDVTDTDDLNADSEWSIFPNPVDNQLFINPPSNLTDQDVQVQVFDAIGQLVDQYNFQETLQGTLELDLSELSSGIYFVQVKTANSQWSQKIIRR
ncbi:MAG: T9SS type A sorting domain-containing protein [Bacteroidota bacterium]